MGNHLRIETEHIILREWREGDRELYARMCADPEVMRYLPKALTREESDAQIDRFICHWNERGYGLWAVKEKESGDFVGFIGLLYQEDWTASEYKTEVGWRLDKGFWGRGYATEGAVEAIRFGFEDVGLEGITSICDPRNIASRRVMEKIGMDFIGEVFWRGYEDVFYEILREDLRRGF